MPNPEPPKVWWKSENIRKSVYLAISALVTLVKFFGYDTKFGLGVNLVSLDNLTELVMFVFAPLAIAGTAIWLAIWGILRRIRNGKDPDHPAATIMASHPIEATVAVVERLTGGVPKP
jgi:hypothetical protein